MTIPIHKTHGALRWVSIALYLSLWLVNFKKKAPLKISRANGQPSHNAQERRLARCRHQRNIYVGKMGRPQKTYININYLSSRII